MIRSILPRLLAFLDVPALRREVAASHADLARALNEIERLTLALCEAEAGRSRFRAAWSDAHAAVVRLTEELRTAEAGRATLRALAEQRERDLAAMTAERDDWKSRWERAQEAAPMFERAREDVAVERAATRRMAETAANAIRERDAARAEADRLRGRPARLT